MAGEIDTAHADWNAANAAPCKSGKRYKQGQRQRKCGDLLAELSFTFYPRVGEGWFDHAWVEEGCGCGNWKKPKQRHQKHVR